MIRILITAIFVLTISCSKSQQANYHQFYQGIAQTGKPGTESFSVDTFVVELSKKDSIFVGTTTYIPLNGKLKGILDTVLHLYYYQDGQSDKGFELFRLKKSGSGWKGFANGTLQPYWSNDTATSVKLAPYELNKENFLKKGRGVYRLTQVQGVEKSTADFNLFPIDSCWFGSITKISANGVREGFEPQFSKADRAILDSFQIEITKSKRVVATIGDRALYDIPFKRKELICEGLSQPSTLFPEVSESLTFFGNQLAIACFGKVNLSQTLGVSAVNFPKDGELFISYLYEEQLFQIEHKTADGSITVLTFQKNIK